MIEWEDPVGPPIKRRRKSDWASVAAELRASPGRWGVIFRAPLHEGETGVPRRANNLQNSVSTGRSIWFRPSGSFEATAQAREGVCKVYARYIGGGGGGGGGEDDL